LVSASLTDHEQQRDSNLRLAMFLQAAVGSHPALDDWSGWAITVGFYAALHHIELFLPPRDSEQALRWGHAQRARAMRSNPRLRPVYFYYKALEDQSRSARYDCARFEALEAAALISTRLLPILSISPQ
jgi:hypothetical protein